MVKISKFGFSDSEIRQIVKANSGLTYTGNVFSIDRPKTQREYIVEGISGTLTADDFEYDDFDTTRIRTGALAGCTDITSIEPFEVDMYYGDDAIGAAAFYGCTGLEEININIKGAIQEHAFYGCTNLKTVYIYVEEVGYVYEYPIIGDYAFANCTSLTDIQFNGTMEQWNGGTFGKDWNKNTGEYTVHCTDGDLQKVVVSTEKVIEPLTVTENGVYASDKVDGFKPVTVNVPIPSDTTATVEDIRKGETAYVNGEKVTGTLDVEAIETEAFQAGEKNALNDFWGGFQSYGKRENYGVIGNYSIWTKKTFKPVYDFKPTSVYNAFLEPISTEQQKIDGLIVMKDLEREQGIVFDFSKCSNWDNAFRNGPFSEFNVIDLKSADWLRYTFYGYVEGLERTKRIERFICYEQVKFEHPFSGNSAIEYIGFEGVIAQNGIDLYWSKKLQKESIQKLINTLSPTTSGLSVRLPITAVNREFETSTGANNGSTSQEWLDLIETKSNWTITLA
jgi:hypothetical protein